MKSGLFVLLLGLFLVHSARAIADSEVIRLYPGYVTRLACEGRLFASAVGNEAQVRLEAFPKELGCGALLKPLAKAGRTNLILETSTGTLERVLEIEASRIAPKKEQLSLCLKGVQK